MNSSVKTITNDDLFKIITGGTIRSNKIGGDIEKHRHLIEKLNHNIRKLQRIELINERFLENVQREHIEGLFNITENVPIEEIRQELLLNINENITIHNQIIDTFEEFVRNYDRNINNKDEILRTFNVFFSRFKLLFDSSSDLYKPLIGFRIFKIPQIQQTISFYEHMPIIISNFFQIFIDNNNFPQNYLYKTIPPLIYPVNYLISNLKYSFDVLKTELYHTLTRNLGEQL
jgi:hypothetical protein